MKHLVAGLPFEGRSRFAIRRKKFRECDRGLAASSFLTGVSVAPQLRLTFHPALRQSFRTATGPDTSRGCRPLVISIFDSRLFRGDL